MAANNLNNLGPRRDEDTRHIVPGALSNIDHPALYDLWVDRPDHRWNPNNRQALCDFPLLLANKATQEDLAEALRSLMATLPVEK